MPNVFIYSFRVDGCKTGIQLLPIKESLINFATSNEHVDQWHTALHPESGQQHLHQPSIRLPISINREAAVAGQATRCLGMQR